MRADKDYSDWEKELRIMIAKGDVPLHYEKIVEQIVYYKKYCEDNFDKMFKKR